MAKGQDPTQPLLYNTRTRAPEKLDLDQLEDAVVSGTHSYPAGADINIVDASGKASSVKAEDLQLAISQGYKIERPDQYGVRKYVEENKGVAGAAKAFGLNFADELAMGVPHAIYTRTGDPLEVAKYQALKKQHEAANFAGGALGFAGSLLVGAPLFKGAALAGGFAGRAIESQAAKTLAAAGVKGATGTAAKTILEKGAAKAAELGVEGAIVSAPKAVTEALLGDPEHAAETLMIGGGIGIGLGLAGGLAGQTFKEIQKAASRNVATKEAAALIKSGEEVPEHLQKLVDGEQVATMKQLFQEALGKKKPNAGAIEAAAAEEGVPLFHGMTGASKLEQNAADALVHRSTVAGEMARGEFQKTIDGINNVAERLVGKVDGLEKAELSRAQAGVLAKDEMTRAITAKQDEIAAKFGSVHERTGQMPAETQAFDAISSRIKASDVYKSEMLKGLRSQADDTLADIAKAASVDDIAKIYTRVDSKLRAARNPMSPDNEAANFWQKVKDELRGFEDASVEAGTRAMGMKGAEGAKAAEILTAERAEARKLYAEFKTFLKSVNENFKVGRKASQRDLVEQLASLDPGKLTQKLFQPGNVKSLNFFSQQFPEAFNAIKGVYLQELKMAVTKDGQMNLSSLARRLDNLEPEAQALLFGAQGVKSIQNLKTLVQALPTQKPLNPSGTSYGQVVGRMFTPGGALDNLNDALTYAALKHKDKVAGVLKTEQAMKKAAIRLDELPEALDQASKPKSGFGESIKKKAKAAWEDQTGEAKAMHALVRLFEDEQLPKGRREAFEKAAKVIQDAAEMPEKSAEVSGTYVKALQETGAPKIAENLSVKMAQAIQYLNKELPKPYTPKGLFAQEFKASDTQIAEFEKKVAVVLDPLSTINDLKSGTLTAAHVKALNAVYPKLYQQMQKRVWDWAATKPKKVSYPMKLRLSLFMGMPLDYSVQPDSIQGLQMTFAGENMGGEPGSEMDEPINEELTAADQTMSEMDRVRTRTA